MPAGIASRTVTVRGVRSVGAATGGIAPLATVRPSGVTSVAVPAPDGTDPRPWTVSVTRRPATTTSSRPMPISGRCSTGVVARSSFASITVVACGAKVTSVPALRSSGTVAAGFPSTATLHSPAVTFHVAMVARCGRSLVL